LFIRGKKKLLDFRLQIHIIDADNRKNCIMIVLTIFVLLAIALFFLFAAKTDAPEGILVVSGFVALIVGIFLLSFIVSAIHNYVEFEPSIAEIEQLRKDVARVDLKNAEDVYGQAATMNRVITVNQARNKMFFYDQFIPDGWDNVKLIEIPENQ